MSLKKESICFILSLIVISITGCNIIKEETDTDYTASKQSVTESFSQESSETAIPITAESVMPESDATSDVLTAHEFSSLMNVGWNLGNSLDSHYGDRTEKGAFNQETLWGNVTVTKELIDYVAELGFNTIRIPVTWYYNTYNDTSGLHIQKQWLERVQEVVDYAMDNDMYVIINSHHDQPLFYAGTDETSFLQVLSDTEDLWGEIGNHFIDYNNHLIFESFNEIDNIEKSWNFSEKAAAQMNRMNQVFVDTIRSIGGNNAERLLIVPTLLDGCTDDFLDAFTLPEDTISDRLIIQVHNYSPQFDQDIEPFFNRLEAFAAKTGAPVLIGEFGTKASYTPAEYRGTAISNYVARAANHGIKCIYWDDGNINHFGLIDRRDFTCSQHALLQALLSPTMCETPGKRSFCQMSDFLWMTLNQSTGELKEDPWWGTIITREAIAIPSDAEYITLSLETSGNAVGQKIHYVHFYDQNGILLEAHNDSTGYTANTHAIPKGAYTVRIGINCSNHATSEEQFQEYFMNNWLSLIVGFI